MDEVTYSWMGDDGIWNSTAIVVDIQITPTRSIFVMQAGPMNVTVTYLSPIEVRLPQIVMRMFAWTEYASIAFRLGQPVHSILLRFC